VESAGTASPFRIGRYSIALTLDQRLTTPLAVIENVMRGPYDTFQANDLDQLFSQDPEDSLFNQDDSGNDKSKNATQITSNNALATTFNVVGSLQEAGDVDFYRVRVPRLGTTQVSNLTVTLTPYSINGVMPDFQLFDKSQKPVPYNVLSNGDGAMVIQAVGLKNNDDYFLRVANAPGQTSTGNYHANLRFGKTATTLQTFFSGALPAADASSTVYLAEPQLFHLLLSTSNGVTVTMNIEDLAGNTLFSLTSNGLPTSSKPVLLQPGEYRIRLTTLGRPATVTLRGDSISDPIGSVVVDPNQAPVYPTPGKPGTNTYPNGTVTTKPYLWLSLTI
jgi:hypothetical protein